MQTRKRYEPSEEVRKLKEATEYLGTIIKTYEHNYAEIGRYDKQLNEYAHEIELLDLSSFDLAKKTKEFQIVRQNRRDAKNQNLMLAKIHQTLVRYPAGLITELRKCVTDMEKTEKHLRMRVYQKENGAKIIDGHLIEEED